MQPVVSSSMDGAIMVTRTRPATWAGPMRATAETASAKA